MRDKQLPGFSKLPRMYPFSLMDCSVGRFKRNFISLVRTFFGSVSPAELDEWVMLGLEAGRHLQMTAGFVASYVQTGSKPWRRPSDLHLRLSVLLPNLSSRAASVLPIFSYRSESSSSEWWSWYSWTTSSSSSDRSIGIVNYDQSEDSPAVEWCLLGLCASHWWCSLCRTVSETPHRSCFSAGGQIIRVNIIVSIIPRWPPRMCSLIYSEWKCIVWRT